MRIMDKGQEDHFLVEEPQVLDALQAFKYNMSKNLLVRAGQAMKQALTVDVTISPTFKIRNLVRGVFSAIATNEVSYNPVDGWCVSASGLEHLRASASRRCAMRLGSLNDGNQARSAKRLVADRDQIIDTS